MDRDAAIRNLLDRQAIRETMLRYIAGFERKDRERVMSCFAAGAKADYEGIGRGSAEEVMSTLFGMAETLQETFVMGQDPIEVEGDAARSEIRALSTHAPHGGTDPERIGIWSLRYQDSWQRGADGSWRITDRVVRVDWKASLRREG
jgi:ketosteroid isomerase-like protein